LFYLT